MVKYKLYFLNIIAGSHQGYNKVLGKPMISTQSLSKGAGWPQFAA